MTGEEDGAGDGVLDVSRWYGTVASSMSFCSMAEGGACGFLIVGDVIEKMHARAGFVPGSRVVKVEGLGGLRALCSEYLAE